MGAIGAPPEKNHNATFIKKSICQNYHNGRTFHHAHIYDIHWTSARRSGRASLKRQGKFQVSGNTDDAAKRRARACH
jgi:hypothetical protein